MEDEQGWGRSRLAHEIIVHPQFWSDLRYWIETHRRTAIRVLELVQSIMHDPNMGIGNPERLRHTETDVWSHRITREHRLVFEVSETQVTLIQARYHY